MSSLDVETPSVVMVILVEYIYKKGALIYII